MAQHIDEQSALAQSSARSGKTGKSPGDLSTDLQQHHAQMRDATASIDQHLQQMASWKQQLEQQMDLLQRDGLKVLEQQKHVFEEEARLGTLAQTLAAERAALESQKASLADEQRTVTASLENQRRDIDGQRNELEAQRARIEPETRRLAEREQKIAEREQALADRETRLSQEQAAVTSRAEALAAERQAIDTRASELQRMLADIDTGRARLDADKQATADALAQSEADLKNRTEGVQQRESELAEALLLLGRESQRLHERRVELESRGASDALQAACATLTAEKARLEALLSESQKSLSGIEQRAATLTTQIEELTAQRTAANDRAVEYQATIASCEARSADLAAEKATIAAQLAAAEARANEIAARAADSEKQNQTLTAENTALNSERAKLADQIDRLTSQNTAVLAEIKRLTAERNGAVQKTADAAKSAGARAAEFEKLASNLGEERNALTAKVETLERERTELLDQRTQLESRATELEQRCASLKAALDAAARSGDEERDKAKHVKERNALLEKKILALQTDVDGTGTQRDARLAALTSERDAQRQRANAAVQRCAELERALVDALAQLDAANSARSMAGVASSTEQNEDEIAQQRGRVKELRAERDALPKRVSGLRPQAQDPESPRAAAISTPDDAGPDVARNASSVGDEPSAEIKQNERLPGEQEPEASQTPAPSRPVRTLATIVFGLLLVFGLPFAGVYSLVPPVFRSEAVVQLQPPRQLKNVEVPKWLARQVSEVRTNPHVLDQAWAQMRDKGYSRYANKEDWLAALPSNMDVKLDVTTNKLTIAILDNSQTAVCLVANSIAAAYAHEAVLRDDPASSSGQKAAAELLVPAAPSAVAVIDKRMSKVVSISLALLLASLLAATLVQRSAVKKRDPTD